jgi:hypothetical protein
MAITAAPIAPALPGANCIATNHRVEQYFEAIYIVAKYFFKISTNLFLLSPGSFHMVQEEFMNPA